MIKKRATRPSFNLALKARLEHRCRYESPRNTSNIEPLSSTERSPCDMSSRQAAGADAFNFLSNISLSSQDGHSRPSKRPKPGSTRLSVSHKPATNSKNGKPVSTESVEIKTRNSRSTSTTADDSPSKPVQSNLFKSQDAHSTPSKSKVSTPSRHGARESKDGSNGKYATPSPLHLLNP